VTPREPHIAGAGERASSRQQNCQSSSRKADPRRRPVQEVRVEMIGVQVIDRRGERLAPTARPDRRGIVRQPVILPVDVGALGCRTARRASGAVTDRVADGGFESSGGAGWGGVDGGKAGRERPAGERAVRSSFHAVP